jgi:hypothetical protein
MKRPTRHAIPILTAVLAFVGTPAQACSPASGVSRVELQAQLRPLSTDLRDQAAAVGREMTGRIVAGMSAAGGSAPAWRLAEARGAAPDRS